MPRHVDIARARTRRLFTWQPIILAVGFLGICLTAPAVRANPAVPVVPPKAVWFGAADVRLLAGPFKTSEDAAAKYLLSLDLDRLVAPYRIAVGLPPKAPQYLGWETKNLPGVALGFYLSGMARLVAGTADPEYGRRLAYALTELELCQREGHGYLLGTTNGRQILARVEREGYWDAFGRFGGGEATPYYSMEKLLSGLRDVYRVCREPRALGIAVALGNWLNRHMSHLSDQQLQTLMKVEFGGMNWVLADLYADTGDSRFLAMSKRWQHRWLTDALEKNEDELVGKHANAQFPKVSGLAARYPYTGDQLDLGAARFFWETVAHRHTYATGGNSNGEHFGFPGQLAEQLTPFTEENCNTYNMLRLTALLFAVEPRMDYADFIERALYNHILPMQRPADGLVCYFLPLLPGGAKIFEPPHDSFTCCVCSGMDSYVRHSEYLYAHSDTDLFVNLFVASEVAWRARGVSLRQETRFPESDTSVLRVTAANPAEFSLNVRVPFWATQGFSVHVNGTAQELPGRAGAYVRIMREWRTGDTVTIKAPLVLRTEPLPDDPERVALFSGPVLLAGVVPANDGWTAREDNTRAVVVADGQPASTWVTPGAQPLHFSLNVARPAPIPLKPLYQIDREHYSVYWDTLAETTWLSRKHRADARHAEARERDARTVDRVIVGDTQSESAHAFAGKTTTRYPPGQGPASPGDDMSPVLMGYHLRGGGLAPERNYRVANGRNSFSYELAIPTEGRTDLVIVSFGRTPYPRNYRLNYLLKIDDAVVRDERSVLGIESTPGLSERIVALPPEVTARKSKIKITFEAREGGRTPSVTELRSLRR